MSAPPDDKVDGVTADTARLSMENNSSFHPRPDFGTAGTKIQVAANMYQARFLPDKSIFHYHMTITPHVKVAKSGNDKEGNKGLNKNLGWKVWLKLKADAQGPVKASLDAGAFDQTASMYTPIALPGGGQAQTKIEVILDESGKDEDRKRYSVVLQPANKIDMNAIVAYCKGDKQSEKTKDIARTAIQAANILLRQDPYEKQFFPTNHGHKFLASTNVSPIPNGAQVHLGFMQSFRPTQSGLPAIQLDTAYSACLKPGMLTDAISEILGSGGGGGRGGRGGPRGGFRGGPGRGGAPGGHGGATLRELSPTEQRRVLGVLRMAKFKVTHRQTDRAFTIMGFGRDAESEKFLVEGRDGKPDKEVSVAQYFKMELNMTVTKSGLPCVRYGKRNLVPMEFVKLEPYNRIQTTKLTGDQAAAMIKVTAKPPPERMQLTKNWRKDLDYNALPKVKAWGMSVNPEMMTCTARILPAPVVNYANKKTARVQRGAWNVAGSKFFKAGEPLKAWGVLIFDRYADENGVKNGFMAQFGRVLQMQGIVVSNDPEVNKIPDDMDTFVAIKRGLVKTAKDIQNKHKMHPQLIICVVARRDLVFYKELKKAALDCWEKPIVTQIMQSGKMMDARGLEAYMGNLSMKIHAKIGGITHAVSHPKLDSTTMMIGADVTHPPARRGGDTGPIQASVAVTVASINGDNNQYKECIRLQTGTKEIIDGMTGMVKTHLETFIANQKAKPAKIIMFRDGVSEGQYAQVVNEELAAIRAAARQVGGDSYKPKITFVVCAKRHHMRFYAMADANKDKTGNLPAGTVVDSGVTDPFIFEFYLQAHPGLQGTAKPTHYVVVSDDNKFKADEMQSLCNALCYTYARAARAVFLIPVAYYADVIAGKCRDFIYMDDDSSSVGATGANIDPFELARKIEGTNMAAVAWYM